MNNQDWLKYALAQMYPGQWYGFRKNFTGDERMSYENIMTVQLQNQQKML